MDKNHFLLIGFVTIALIYSIIIVTIEPGSFVIDTSSFQLCQDEFNFNREFLDRPPKSFLDQVEQRFAKRRELLDSKCADRTGQIEATIKTDNWFQKDHYGHFTDFISLEPPVFGCAALKASSGLWRQISMFWKNKTFDEGQYKAEIDSFTQTDINEIITDQSALRVTVTRHPLARFASAWAQKFRANGEFDKGRADWLRQWPGLAPLLLNGTSHRVAFGSFLDYFLTIGPNHFNPHWRLASDSCQVCSRPYDWVVKEETADSDLIFLSHRFNLKLPDSFYTQMKGKSAMSNNQRAYTNWDGTD